jgi:two-component system, NarL family, invasion response regulator UvrY
MSRIRIMLVDDHAVVRTGFRLLLAACKEIEVVGEMGSGEDAYQGCEELKPDVVVMDIAMPGMGGIEAVRRMVVRDRHVKVLALSAYEDTAHPKRILNAGALGYLSKRSAPEELIDAVHAVAEGRPYLDAQIAQKLAMQSLSGAANPVECLSKREFEVFMQLAHGQTVAQIAESLHVSASTIGTHSYSVKRKLNVSNQAELTLIAVRNGLIEA